MDNIIIKETLLTEDFLEKAIQHHNEMMHFIEQSVPADALCNFSEDINAYKTAILAMRKILENHI